MPAVRREKPLGFSPCGSLRISTAEQQKSFVIIPLTQKKHLERYLSEFEYRQNNRKEPDLFIKTVARMCDTIPMPMAQLTADSLVRNFQFFGKTQTDAARALLEIVGHPLTTEEIMEGVEKGGVKLGGKTPKDKKQNFYTILNRSKEFGRAARNTWGIVGWPGISKSEAAENGDEAKKAE
jgi:HB1, ASXL, restriction endonuclease HTH domain